MMKSNTFALLSLTTYMALPQTTSFVFTLHEISHFLHFSRISRSNQPHIVARQALKTTDICFRGTEKKAIKCFRDTNQISSNQKGFLVESIDMNQEAERFFETSHKQVCTTASNGRQKRAPQLSRGIAIGILSSLVAGGFSLPASAAPTSNPGAAAPTSSGNPAPAASTAGAILGKAARKAFGGGLSGATAGILQVLSFMWLRTTMNYQYRYGGSMGNTLRILYRQGGIGRFYRGLSLALVQQPLSRFGDVAANAGVVALLSAWEPTRDLPLFAQTAAGSAAAALWRVSLMPVDTIKTTLQVEGKDGFELMREKIRVGGFGVLFEGAAATLGGTFVGHYPWFVTFNTLQALIPQITDDILVAKLVRNAFIGLCSSCVSDCCSNSLRVIKTTKQTSSRPISYVDAVKLVVDKDGFQGLFGRGLYTRLLTNGLQGMMFSVLWKLFEEYVFTKGG